MTNDFLSDLKNIVSQLDGETWRSSQPRYAPKNAASLMTPGGLLTPEQASTGDNVIAEDDQVGLQILFYLIILKSVHLDISK